MKRTTKFERRQALCIRVIGKNPWGHLRNWTGPVYSCLKGLKKLIHQKEHRIWWSTSVISELERLRQHCHALDASLSYTVTSQA